MNLKTIPLTLGRIFILSSHALFNSANISAVKSGIQNLLQKGVIKPSTHEEGGIISPIFVRPKKDGPYRPILNLKQLNEYAEYYHFKMDTPEAAIRLMKLGCYMASIDLKDAYYTVAVHFDHQKYLKFMLIFERTLGLYQYTCLPNGLSSALRSFTKLLKPVYATLRSMGHINSGCIDDFYLQGDTFNECSSIVTATDNMMTSRGFTLHPDKSVFIPTQVLIFLGFILNSTNMSVSPTPENF